MPDPDPSLTSLTLLRGMITPDLREQSWERFLQRYLPILRRWLTRYRLPDPLPEEILSTVTYKLFRNLRSYDPDQGRFRSWLRAILSNTVHDCLRDIQRHPANFASGQPDVNELLHQVRSPDSLDALADEVQAEEEALAEQVIAVVRGRIAPKSWEAFVRLNVEGATAQQVAEQLGMTPAAVYQAAYRIRELLQAERNRLLVSE